MSKKLIFKKVGVRGSKEIDSDEILSNVKKVIFYSECLELYKSNGRPKTILHQWIFEDYCKFKNVTFNNIMEWTKETRKEILDEYYGKEFIDSESSEILFNEITRKGINISRGD